MAEWVENILAFASMGALMGGLLCWVAIVTPGT